MVRIQATLPLDMGTYTIVAEEPTAEGATKAIRKAIKEIRKDEKQYARV